MKLFVTVGGHTPFDRLVEAVDRWCGDHPEHRVRFQIGDGQYVPEHAPHDRFLPPDAFDALCDEVDALVGHAGIGTLFAALERRKPVLVLPRRAALVETRNDHQVATARRYGGRPGVLVAEDETQVARTLDRLVAGVDPPEPPRPDPGLVAAIRAFIDQG